MKMIDISAKKAINREAIAVGKILLKHDTIKQIRKGKILKGNPLIVAEISAVNAVKQTQLLIPLCHQIPITSVKTCFNTQNEFIEATVTVKAIAKTGVEMESLIGVSMALNTIWDMVKYLEKDAYGQYPTTRIENIRVIKKIKKTL